MELLLPSADNQNKLLLPPPAVSKLRIAIIALGIFVVLVGAADVAARLAHAAFGDNANTAAFAPVASAHGTDATSTITAIVPARLRIPSIGVDAKVEAVRNKPDGSMATPSNFQDVAWYSPGSEPGNPGNAVFAGHVNNALTSAGVFEHLSQLSMGDYITVESASGQAIVYVVTNITVYPADSAPAASIFSTVGPSGLALITCDGEWDSIKHSFNQRLVVLAQRAR
jgi:LPXTG-site transpeptidase (sortase) family protein